MRSLLILFLFCSFSTFLLAQKVTNDSLIPKSEYGSISCYYFPTENFEKYYLSTGFLFKAKKENWMNTVKLDITLFDFVQNSNRTDNFTHIQFAKNYTYRNAWCVIRNSFGLGPYMYQYNLNGYESRNWGLAISEGIDIGIAMGQIDITVGYFISIGWGYFKQFNYQYPSGVAPFRFGLSNSPLIKITFKH